jgi:hypothetical protein
VLDFYEQKRVAEEEHPAAKKEDEDRDEDRMFYL